MGGQLDLPFGGPPEPLPIKPSWLYETQAIKDGFSRIAGLDEAGRGPLCGPVVVGAVILNPECIPPGLNDSKLLTASQREALYDAIVENALAWAVAESGPAIIDDINILEATIHAGLEALDKLDPPCDFVLTDALKLPLRRYSHLPLIKGDRKSLSISAGSILAKVTRDRLMDRMHEEFPMYGFREHKGYPTAEHREALRRYGPCPYHRKTFRGVRELLEQP